MSTETRGVPDAIHHTDTSETLEYITGWNDCRQAMLAEQPAPKVVDCHAAGVCVQSGLRAEQPAQRTWVGLTNDEVNNFAAGCHLGNSVQGAIYRAEAKLKEKNT